MKSVNSFKRSAQAGFTLIELVVVIVILGILAATAIPKFSDLSSDARIAKMNAARASIQTASSVFHASWLAKGSPADGGAAISMEGTSIVYKGGYPTMAGMILAAGGLTDYVTSSSATGGVLTVTPDAGHTGCTVTYTEAVSPAAPVISAAPTTGC